MQQRHKKFCRHVGGSCRMLKTLNYDFRNLFVVFAATFAPVYCGQKYVSFPYCAPHFIPIRKGNLCAICELAVVFWVFRCRSRERKLRMILFNRKSSQFILVIATFKNSIWGWLCWIPWVFVIKEGASVQQLTLLDDYWKVNPCKPFNKGTSSAGMREAAAGWQKTELWLWLQKAFCWWCSNFYTYIPWSVRRMCPVHIVQHALFQSYKEISALYVSLPLWVPMLLGAECASLFQEISSPMHISISVLHSTFENHVERYGRTITKKSWTNLRVFLRDWRRLFSDHWNDSRSKTFHVCSLFTIWNFSLCFCFPFSVSDNEKCQ